MPVDRAWAELLVHAKDELVPYLAVMSSVESLHRMTREERDLEGSSSPAATTSPRTTSTPRRTRASGNMGMVYGLPRHLFDEERIERVGGAPRVRW
jgi:ATP-dependent helicase HrpA